MLDFVLLNRFLNKISFPLNFRKYINLLGAIRLICLDYFAIFPFVLFFFFGSLFDAAYINEFRFRSTRDPFPDDLIRAKKIHQG